ncbi:MAG: hypothetical protein F7C37_06120 [Desulfurococcales archaeon]|nr:hypothetical protein [Desulfurococcales archaeon]
MDWRLVLGILAVALFIVPVAGAFAVPLADTIAIRAFDGANIQNTPPATIKANITNDSLIVADTNTSDGVRPAVDLGLTVQMGGPVVLRANTTLMLGDPTANTVATSNNSVIWYDPETGEYRVWVPGKTYLSVSRIYAIPANETQRVGMSFASYEVLATPLAASTSIKGSTSSLTDAVKKTINLKAGASVTVQVVSQTGHHDVYIFKPSNPSYNSAKQSTGQGWAFYSANADWKIWYPATTTSFTAPEDGDYLFVVVPYNQPGSFQVNIAIQGGGGQVAPTPVEGGDTGGTSKLKSAISGSSLAIAIIIIIVIALGVWFFVFPYLGWRK